MQETKKTGLGLSEEVALKTALLSLRSRLYRVSGSWHWPMQSDALYCSDAMDFPADVEGTKAIFHPDDLPTVSSALELLQTEEIELLSFRIITTYGEVKEVTGTGIGLQKEAPEAAPVAAVWEEAVNDWARLKAFEDLSQHRMGTDAAEKMQGTGLWYINKATAAVFYSDGVFRLHGLPPQSLNAHPNTFYPFIHPEDQATVEEALDRAYRQEVPLHLDYRVVLQSGEERHLRLTTAWGFNRQGQALFTGLLQNITASVEGEGRLQQAAADVDLHGQLLSLSERHAATGHWHVNLLTRKTVFSANLNRLYGMKAGLPPTKNVFLGFVHADDREAVEKANNKMYREHTPPEIEFRLVRPDGKERWMRQTAKLVVSGDALLMIGAVQDVTVLKGLEKKTVELKDAALLQEALNNGLENISGVRTVVWWTADNQMSWSPGFYHLLGYKPGTVDASQALWHRQIHPSDLKAFKDTVTLVTNGQHVPDLTFRLVNKGGIRHFRLRFETFNTGAREGVIGFAENITTAMAANRDRAAVEQLQQAIYNTVTDAIILTDEQNTVTAWNRAAADITGIAEQEAVQQNLFDLLPNLHQRSFLDRLQQVRSGEAINIVVTKEEWYGRGPHQAFITPLLDAEGALYAVLHVVRDTTREQSLRKQLSQRLNFIESLVEASAERIVVLDAGMNYLYWNRKAEEWYGIDKERVLGRNILELFPGFRSDPGYAEFRKVLRGEHVFLPAVADESGRHFENHLSPIKNEEGDVTAVLWAVHDRTKEWELKNQSQKALEILNALNENFLELDRKFRVVFVNSKALQFFDKTEADVQGKVLWDIYPELIDTALHLALEHAVQERVPVRDEFTSPAHGVTLLVSIAPTGTGVAVAFSDIQFIKDAEHKLAEEHRRLKEAQSIGAIGSFEWTFGADEVAWSDEMYRVCNLEPQSQRITIGFTESLVLPEDLPRLLDLKESSFVTPGNYELQHRILLFDGTIKWVQHRFESLADEAGNIVRIHGTLQDISELKAAEERLAVEHRRLNEAQTVGRVGSFEWTVGEEAVQWSAEMFRINGLDPATKESKASTIEEVIHPNDRTAFEQKKAASLKVPGRYGLVHRILINGEEKCVNHQWESVAGDDGTVQRVRGIVQDVTGQKNAERELQRTKDLLQDIIDAPNIGLAVYKAVRNNLGQIVDFVHEFINRTTLTALGQDFTGRLLSEHGEEGTAQLQKFIEALETGKSNSYTKHSTLNGAPHWVGFSNAPLDGDRLIHTWEDITERKVAEQELLQLKDAFAQRAVDKYHKIITSMEQGFCVLECLFNQQGTCINWRYLDANPVFKKQSGYEAVIGKTVNDLVPDVEQGWKDMYGAVALTGRPERREDYVQATNRWYDVSAFRIDSPEERHVAVLFNDITGRKHREQQQAFLLTFSDTLRTLPNKEAIEETSLQLLAGFLNLDRAYIATVYKQDDRAVIGPEYRRPHLHLAPISGEQHMATLPESFGQVDVQTLVVNDMATNAALLEQHRQPLGATSLNALVVASVRQGEQAVVWSLVASTTTPRKWTRDEVLLIEAVAERTWAAAERAEAEKEIRFSESRFRILAETLPLIISLAAPDGTLQYINHWWTEFSGKSAEAFMTGDWLQAIHPDDRDTVVQAWQNALATGERYQYEFRALSKDGSYRWLLARGLPVKEDDGTITN